MSGKPFVWPFLATAALGMTLTTAAWAQQQKDQQQKDSSNQQSGSRRYTTGRPVEGQSDADRSIARLLGNMNKVEVELTQFAEDRGDIDAINNFARDQNREHSINLEELQQFAPDAGAGIGRSAMNANRTDSADQERSKAFDWRQVSQEIANENLRSAKKELRDRDGLDFDWGFVGQQKLFHDALCADMTVLRRYASPALRQVIDNQLIDVKKDQSTLEDLMTQLKREEQRRMAGGRQRSDSANTQTATTTGGRSNRGQPYVDEFEYAEAAFTVMARLGEGQGGRPTLGVQLDGRARGHASVAQVRSGSPAEKAGLQPGDDIVAVNGQDIDSPDDLARQISRLAPGDRVELTIDRSFSTEQRIPLRAGSDSDRRQNSRPNRSTATPQGAENRDNDHSSD